ncbi:hypothetical protein STEG23_013623 [Scotinomys teguina]
MGPVFVPILLTCIFLLVGKIFFNDFVEYVSCAFELVSFSFFYSYYSKILCCIMGHSHVGSSAVFLKPCSGDINSPFRTKYSTVLNSQRFHYAITGPE